MKVTAEEINILEAAPDLLGACKDALNLICKCCKSANPNYHSCESCKDVKFLQQAITKAEGGNKNEPNR